MEDSKHCSDAASSCSLGPYSPHASCCMTGYSRRHWGPLSLASGKKTQLSILSQRSSPGRNRRVNEDMDLQIFLLWLQYEGRAVQVSTNKALFGAFLETEIEMIGTCHALFLGVALSCLTSPHWKSTVVVSLRCVWLTFYSPPGRERGRKLRWVAGAQKQSYMILQWDLWRMQLGLHDKELHCYDVCQSTSNDASHTTALQLHWQTAASATPGSLLPLGLLV